MEGLLWDMVRRLLQAVQEAVPRGIYSDREVFEVSLWSVLHDRPACWACDAGNWPANSTPAFTACQHRIARFTASDHAALYPAGASSSRSSFSGRKGRHHRRQTAACQRCQQGLGCHERPWHAGMSRGYKLHCVMSLHGVVEAFEVQPLNVNERVPARRLCQKLPPQVRPCLGRRRL